MKSPVSKEFIVFLTGQNQAKSKCFHFLSRVSCQKVDLVVMIYFPVSQRSNVYFDVLASLKAHIAIIRI
jgi:hypothetical protein